jgi:hypothetical protein
MSTSKNIVLSCWLQGLSIKALIEVYYSGTMPAEKHTEVSQYSLIGDEIEMAVGKVSFPSVMDIYDITEMFSRYYVDPAVAQHNVPLKWKVKIHDNGKALLLVMVQNCRKMVLDYLLNVGSVGMSHVWIELDGPPETVSTLPGTTRSLPTWYWYILPHQLDDRWARALFGLVGVAAQKVSKISLGGDPGGTRHGEVIESDSPTAKYNWTETSKLYPEPDIVTGSHRFYRKYGSRESEAHAKCFTHFLGDSQVSLIATPDSAIGKLGFGTSLTGFANPVWVKQCRVKYRVGYF